MLSTLGQVVKHGDVLTLARFPENIVCDHKTDYCTKKSDSMEGNKQVLVPIGSSWWLCLLTVGGFRASGSSDEGCMELGPASTRWFKCTWYLTLNPSPNPGRL